MSTAISPYTTGQAHFPVRAPALITLTDADLGVDGVVLGCSIVQFNSIATNGNTMQLEWADGGDVTFTFKTTPDADNPTEIGIAGASIQAWLTNTVLPKVAAHPDVAARFQVDVRSGAPNLNKLFFTNLLPTGNTTPLSDVTQTGTWLNNLSHEAGSDAGGNAGEYIRMSVLRHSNAGQALSPPVEIYTPVVTEDLTVITAEGAITVDVSETLKGFVEPIFPGDITTITELPRSSTRFRVRAQRKSVDGDTGAITYGPVVDTPTLHAILAGRSAEDMASQPDWGEVAAGAFLSNWPNTTAANAKRVDPDQHEYLAFCAVPDEGSTAQYGNLRCRITLAETGASTVFTLLTFPTLQAGAIYVVPAGYAQHKAAIDAAATTLGGHAIAYDLWVSGTDNVVINRRYYRIDYDHRERRRYLHYFNTVGGIDTVPLYGDRSSSITPSMDEVIRTLTPAQITGGTIQPERLPVLNGWAEDHQAGTAWLYRDEVNALRDLAVSTCIVERDAIGQLRPVVLTDRRFAGTDEADGLATRTIKYSPAHTLRGHNVLFQ